MILKEFELTIPADREIRRVFQLQTRCVTSLYERLFPKFKTESCWKVIVECVDVITKEYYREALGVGVQQVEVDVECFFALPDAAKKEWTLETLQTGINKLLEQTGWPVEPFLETYQKAKDFHLVNHWIWKKNHSPSRKLVAEVLIEHEVKSCDISIIVYDRNHQEINREKLISELPDEWAYSRHLGTLKWESESQVILLNKNGDNAWHLDLL
jgi:hypothetical protein